MRPKLKTVTDLRAALALALASGAALSAWAAPAAAQRSSGEIVQPLPAAESATLRDALRRLSRNPVDLFALLDAGDASVVLGDLDAANGFYTRAVRVSPRSGRALAGFGRVAVRRMQPVEALGYFQQAEQTGLSSRDFAAERGLAYDLVGDNARAQQSYRLALRGAGSLPSVRRNLAMSLAISGNRPDFESTLLPLLNAGDRAAFRTRAFGLSVMGETEEAVVIAELMMPTDLALRMASYLRMMPRLTKSQQAAAGNLGIFPAAAEIGRDPAVIAAYDGRVGSPAAAADAALVPSGPQLGTRASAPAQTRRARPDRPGSAAGDRVQRRAASDPLQRTQVTPRVRAQQSQVAADRPATNSPSRAANAQTAASAPAPEPALVANMPLQRPVPRDELPAVSNNSRPNVAQPATALATPDRRETTVEPQPASVADAFSGFATADTPASTRVSGGVDIRAIEPPREVEEAEPPAPQHPSRHWVQVATGRDLAALKFDWRRIARRAEGALDGKGPFTAPWGQANRLLAGPYDDAISARQKVNELKDVGLDTFTFTSDEGEAIASLD